MRILPHVVEQKKTSWYVVKKVLISLRQKAESGHDRKGPEIIYPLPKTHTE